MKEFTFGEHTDPTISIIGGIHGDEPLTAATVLYTKHLLNNIQDINTQVNLVIANELALSEDERYIDEDLNRLFGTDYVQNTHETSLAADIESITSNSYSVLAIHSSKSVPPGFSVTKNIDKNRELLKTLPFEYTIEDETEDGALESIYSNTINVEVGRQKTNQVFYNGIKAVRSFLSYHNVLEDQVSQTETEKIIMKYNLVKAGDNPQVYYSNFEDIKEGSVIAEDSSITHIATNSNLTPVLLSKHGYHHKFGLIGERKGTI